MYLPVNQIYIRLQRLTSEKSDRLVPKLSARAFMGLFGGGTSRAATLNYEGTCNLFCAFVHR